jgi:N-acetylmuramoyl-L-alanine amidase
VLVDPDTDAIILSEAEFNLDVALRSRDILLARGASVVLTRESADTFTAPWPIDANGDGETGDTFDDLQQRVDILNSFQAEVFLSIHANGGLSDPPAEQDLQVLYCGTDDCSFPGESKRLGQLVLDRLQAKLTTATGAGYGGSLLTDLSTDSSDLPEHLFVLGPVNLPRHVRATSMPGVLAESLYVTSPEQAAQLKQDNVRQAIALAYADALQAYLTGK